MSDRPDHRLAAAYEEATRLDAAGLKGLCPSYSELLEEREHFRVEGLLGKGAVKEVYKAYNKRSRRWVAMARLRSDRGTGVLRSLCA